jgi:hypothetical protein
MRIDDLNGSYLVYIDRVHDDGSRLCKNEGARLRRWCQKHTPSLIDRRPIYASYVRFTNERVIKGAHHSDYEYGRWWVIHVVNYMDAFKIVMWRDTESGLAPDGSSR